MIGLGQRLRRPLYDLAATRACLDAQGFDTFEFVDVQPPGLRVQDAEGQVTFLGFFESVKAAKDHALPPFAHMPSGIGPEVHRNVVVSNLAAGKDAVVDCLRARERWYVTAASR